MENTTQTSAPAPTPAPTSGGWKTMGIIAVIFAGLSILFSFIPCLGAYAMFFGFISGILSVIGLAMANKAKASKTLAIVALALSVASIGIGYWEYLQLKKAAAIFEGASKSLDSLSNAFDSLNIQQPH